MYIFVVRY